MTKQADGRRQRYLDDASSLLLSTSPAVSAHLRQASRTSNPDEDHADRNGLQYCSACGTTLIRGWTCKTLPNPSHKRSRKDRIEKGHSNIKRLRVQCLTCDAITALEVCKPAQTPKESPRISPAERAEVDQARAGPVEIETASQPPRKRTRGKKSSLQSMLSDQKAPPQRGFDLTDFLK